MGKTILQTRRCIVREFTMEDMNALFELYGQPGITRFVEPLYHWDKEMQYQENYIERIYGVYGYGLWMVEERRAHHIIGRIGVEKHEGDPEDTVELGYVVSTDWQGQGIATEVCRAVLQYTKETIQAKQVYVRIHPNNQASNHLARRLGFAPTSRFDAEDRIWIKRLL